MAGPLGTGEGDESEQLGANVKETGELEEPGPDGITSFWLIAFRRPVVILRGLLFGMMEGPDRMPDWLVRGRTVLIPKYPKREWNADKYM